MFKFKAQDQVKVVSGKDKGKTGKIEKVILKEEKIVVSGVNIYKRHKKVTKNQPAGIFEITRPISVSKVALICPKCQKLTRVGFIVENKSKKRICKKCKGVLT